MHTSKCEGYKISDTNYLARFSIYTPDSKLSKKPTYRFKSEQHILDKQLSKLKNDKNVKYIELIKDKYLKDIRLTEIIDIYKYNEILFHVFCSDQLTEQSTECDDLTKDTIAYLITRCNLEFYKLVNVEYINLLPEEIKNCINRICPNIISGSPSYNINDSYDDHINADSTKNVKKEYMYKGYDLILKMIIILIIRNYQIVNNIQKKTKLLSLKIGDIDADNHLIKHVYIKFTNNNSKIDINLSLIEFIIKYNLKSKNLSDFANIVQKIRTKFANEINIVINSSDILSNDDDGSENISKDFMFEYVAEFNTDDNVNKEKMILNTLNAKYKLYQSELEFLNADLELDKVSLNMYILYIELYYSLIQSKGLSLLYNLYYNEDDMYKYVVKDTIELINSDLVECYFMHYVLKISEPENDIESNIFKDIIIRNIINFVYIKDNSYLLDEVNFKASLYYFHTFFSKNIDTYSSYRQLSVDYTEGTPKINYSFEILEFVLLSKKRYILIPLLINRKNVFDIVYLNFLLFDTLTKKIYRIKIEPYNISKFELIRNMIIQDGIEFQSMIDLIKNHIIEDKELNREILLDSLNITKGSDGIYYYHAGLSNSDIGYRHEIFTDLEQPLSIKFPEHSKTFIECLINIIKILETIKFEEDKVDHCLYKFCEELFPIFTYIPVDFTFFLSLVSIDQPKHIHSISAYLLISIICLTIEKYNYIDLDELILVLKIKGESALSDININDATVIIFKYLFQFISEYLINTKKIVINLDTSLILDLKQHINMDTLEDTDVGLNILPFIDSLFGMKEAKIIYTYNVDFDVEVIKTTITGSQNEYKKYNSIFSEDVGIEHELLKYVLIKYLFTSDYIRVVYDKFLLNAQTAPINISCNDTKIIKFPDKSKKRISNVTRKKILDNIVDNDDPKIVDIRKAISELEFYKKRINTHNLENGFHAKLSAFNTKIDTLMTNFLELANNIINMGGDGYSTTKIIMLISKKIKLIENINITLDTIHSELTKKTQVVNDFIKNVLSELELSNTIMLNLDKTNKFLDSNYNIFRTVSMFSNNDSVRVQQFTKTFMNVTKSLESLNVFVMKYSEYKDKKPEKITYKEYKILRDTNELLNVQSESLLKTIEELQNEAKALITYQGQYLKDTLQNEPQNNQKIKSEITLLKESISMQVNAGGQSIGCIDLLTEQLPDENFYEKITTHENRLDIIIQLIEQLINYPSVLDIDSYNQYIDIYDRMRHEKLTFDAEKKYLKSVIQKHCYINLDDFEDLCNAQIIPINDADIKINNRLDIDSLNDFMANFLLNDNVRTFVNHHFTTVTREVIIRTKDIAYKYMKLLYFMKPSDDEDENIKINICLNHILEYSEIQKNQDEILDQFNELDLNIQQFYNVLVQLYMLYKTMPPETIERMKLIKEEELIRAARSPITPTVPQLMETLLSGNVMDNDELLLVLYNII